MSRNVTDIACERCVLLKVIEMLLVRLAQSQACKVTIFHLKIVILMSTLPPITALRMKIIAVLAIVLSAGMKSPAVVMTSQAAVWIA
jgi:hypothetical protein